MKKLLISILSVLISFTLFTINVGAIKVKKNDISSNCDIKDFDYENINKNNYTVRTALECE